MIVYLGAGYNQRYVTGPGPTLGHALLRRVCNMQAPVATTPTIGSTVLNHFKRDKPRQRVCSKPRVSCLCNGGLLARAFGHKVLTHMAVVPNSHHGSYIYIYIYIGI